MLKIFLDTRSDLDRYLYDDVIPCLDWLRSNGIKTAVVTNSNAAISSSSTLGSRLDLYLNASDMGCCKPSPIVFLSVIHRLGINPSRVLHVGDNFRNDIDAAKKAGLKTAYIRRPGVVDDTYDGSIAGAAVYPDVELNSLHPEEFIEKLERTFRN